jgi:long-subunit fatty acid transport protein
MRDEVFDLEVEAIWTQTSAVDAFRVDLHDKDPSDPLAPKIQFGNSDTASTSLISQTITVPKHWQNTLSLRAGTDIQLVPEWLAVRGGVSYASSASPVEYMSIDFWPVKKIGVHLGTTVAVGGLKITGGYAHFFYQPVVVPVGAGGLKETVTIDPNKANAVNEGHFRASQDVFSLQVNKIF